MCTNCKSPPRANLHCIDSCLAAYTRKQTKNKTSTENEALARNFLFPHIYIFFLKSWFFLGGGGVSSVIS